MSPTFFKSINMTIKKKPSTKAKVLGYMNITVYNDDSAFIDVDCPTGDLVSTLSSLITSDEGPGELIRWALHFAVADLEKSKKKSSSVTKKKAAPKKK
jgi:hypothetical protein